MWTKLPTALYLPAVPSAMPSINAGSIWTNNDVITPLFRFQTSGGGSSAYRICSRLACQLSLSALPAWETSSHTSLILSPQYIDVNGAMSWSGTSGRFYRAPASASSTSFFFLTTSYVPWGAQPYAAQDSDGVWHGDSWYQGQISGSTWTLSPGGKILNDGAASITLTATWGAHWASSSAFGVYSPEGGAPGNKTFGSPRWYGALGRTAYRFVRSASQTGGYYRYVSTTSGVNPIEHVTAGGGSWQWDAPNAKTYRSADEPSLSAPVSFYPLDGSGNPDTEQTPVVLSLSDYVQGDERDAVLVGDVCRFI